MDNKVIKINIPTKYYSKFIREYIINYLTNE